MLMVMRHLLLKVESVREGVRFHLAVVTGGTTAVRYGSILV